MTTSLERRLLAGAAHNPEDAAQAAETLLAGDDPPTHAAAPTEAIDEGTRGTGRSTSILSDPRLRRVSLRAAERLVGTLAAVTEFTLWALAARLVFEVATRGIQ